MSATLSTHNIQTPITGGREKRGLTVRRLTPRLHRYPISEQGTRSGRSPLQGVGQQHGRTGHAMDRRTHSDGRRSRRNNRLDNRNRWIVAEEGATFLKKKQYSDRPRSCSGFPFVRRNHQKQEESWPSLDSARKIKWTTPS